MSLYADASVAVPATLSRLHREEIASSCRAGTRLTGEECLATVEAAHGAWMTHGLLESAASAGAPPADVQPAASLAMIERLALSPGTFTRRDHDEALAGGMHDGEYVETVSLVSRVVNIDVFARGVGSAPPALHPPEDGEPSYAQVQAVDEGAWVPTVPAGHKGESNAEAAYGSMDPQPFIYRALSYVPAEARRCITGGDVQYLPLKKLTDFSYSHIPGFSRAQVERVAARVSALNGCFY